MKKICILIIILLYLTILCSCSGINEETDETSASALTSVSDSGSSSLTDDEAEANLADITLGNNSQGKPHLTGQLTSNIVIDADVVSNCDLEKPGTGYTYSGNIPAFTDEARSMFISDNLTLIGSESGQCGNSSMIYSGTVYYDTYTDQNGTVYQHAAFPDSVVWYSEHGISIHSFATSVAQDQLVSEDFSFASEKEAYDQAAAILAKEGISVASCYEVKRLPYTTLESAYLISKSYGEDVLAAETNLPNGWSEKEDAYLFTMRYDLNGFPVTGSSTFGFLMSNGEAPPSYEESTQICGSSIEVLVTSAGVEYVRITLYPDNCEVTKDGQMYSMTQALEAFSQALHSPVQNESLYSITNYANGQITITNIELSYICFRDSMKTEASIVPCWQIRCERIVNKDDPQSGSTFAWAYVNAVTGEYIDTATFAGSGEI